MNLGMSTSTIRMLFLSKNFNFLKKVSTKREGQQKFFQRYLPLPFQITTTNSKLKIKESVLSNQFYQLEWCQYFLIGWRLLYCSVPYIFAIPPGWFGRISKTSAPQTSLANTNRGLFCMSMRDRWTNDLHGGSPQGFPSSKWRVSKLS